MSLRSLLAKLAGVCLASTFCFIAPAAAGQTGGSNEWALMSGSLQNSGPGVYGQQGVFAAANVPGERSNSVSWSDRNGNLWLFGGLGDGSTSGGYVYFGYLNDLWEFNPSTNEWAWISGSNVVPINCFPDSTCGQSGVYSTIGTPAASNVPGGRSGSVSWTDKNGNLWLFGGYGVDSAGNYGNLNDLWVFTPSTGQWTWMSGSSTIISALGGQPGVYGTLGTPAASNTPGSRTGSVTWTDNSGILWLFGGGGLDSNGNEANLNDLWEYDISTNQWTWMGGSSNGGDAGSYGAQGVAATTNIPSARGGAVGWVDSLGAFWLFGGFDGNSNTGYLNDLWKFNPSSSEWTWIGGVPPGATNNGVPGVYGTLGTPASANTPGSRANAVGGVDKAGNLWLFGGLGYDYVSPGTTGYFNDLWVFSPVANQWAWMGGSNTAGASSVDSSPGVFNATNVPGSRASGVSWTGASGDFWIFGGADGYYLNDLWEDLPASPTFPPSFALAAGTVNLSIGDTGGDGTTTIASAVAGGFNAPILLSASGQPTGVSVSFSPDSIDGAGTSTATITVEGGAALGTYSITVTGISGNISATTTIRLVLAGAAAPTFSPSPGNYTSAQSVTISDATPGATIYYTTDETIPTSSSNVYNGPITVSSTETLAAIAVANGYFNSSVSVAPYSIGTPSVAGEWAFMGGSELPGSLGSYGVIGAPNAGVVPASRSDAIHWTDKNGNFWLFGGSYNLSGIGEYNDLWKYIPSFKQWEWVAGSKPPTGCTSIYGCGSSGVYGTLGTPARGNTPGSRSGSANWVDTSGNLWLFGGYGYDSKNQFGQLNDLWELNPANNQWTWMGGSSQEVLSFYSFYGNPGVYGTLGVPAPGNIPGSRYDAATWTDAQGNFWLFGGQGQDSLGDNVLLNDLWEYNTTTNQWAWMGGSSQIEVLTGYQSGVYGTLGVPGASNFPGSRSQAATWTDSSGNLWLFGGGPGFVQVLGDFNDLWKYSPSTNQWTWMNGASAPYCPYDPLVGFDACISQPGVYGTLGVPAAGNVPPGGAGLGSWVDTSGNFWIFGGDTSDVTGQNNGFYLGLTNSLWVYRPSTNQWAWMGGNYASSNCSVVLILAGIPDIVCDGSQGNFGILTVPASGNIPAARARPASWTDSNGNFWMFSGLITDTSNDPGEMNDIWEYQPSATTLPAATPPIFSLKGDTYVVGGPLILSNGMTNTSIHYTTDGSTPTFESPLYTGPISISSTQTINAIATAPGYRDSAIASATYVFATPPAAPVFSPPPGPYSSPQQVTISDSTPGASIYYTTDGTAPSASSSVSSYTGPVAVSSTETFNAEAVIVGSGVLDEIDSIPSGYGVPGADASATYTFATHGAPTVTVVPAPTSVSTAQALTATVTVNGGTGNPTPTGSVALTSGVYTSAKATLSGGAAAIDIPAGSLAVGTDTLTAIYTPDSNSSANYTSATGSAAVTVTAAPPTFTVTGTTVSVAPGATTSNTSTVTVTPAGGFTGSVSLTANITSSPSGASDPPTLSFGSTSPVNIAGTAAGTATLTILTTAPTSGAVTYPNSPGMPWYATGGTTLACLLLFGSPFRRRRLRTVCKFVALLVFLMGGMVACSSNGNSESGGSGNPGTTAGTYTISVTGTSGSITETETISLTVQ